MSIDKFGRSSRESHLIRGPKGEGYNRTPEGDFDITGKLLRNVKPPIEGNDAATMAYVKSVIPVEESDHWSFKNKRLSNVLEPLYNGEVVTFGTLKSHVRDINEKIKELINKLTVLEDSANNITAAITDPSNGLVKINARLNVIEGVVMEVQAEQRVDMTNLKTRVSKCEESIASNKKYHDKDLNKLGVLIYKQLHTMQTGRSATIPTTSEGEYVSWEVLLNDESKDDHRPPPNSHDRFITDEEISESDPDRIR